MAIDRRTWVKYLAVGLAAAGCSAPAATPAPKPADSTAPKPAASAVDKPAAQAPAASKPLQEVTFRLDWRVIGYHAPFWAAVDKGFFRDQGLDVKLGEGQGSASTLQLLASGQTFAFLDAGIAAQGIQRGIDLKVIGCMFQRNLFGILSPKDAPITKPQELIGKSIAGAAGGAGEVQWPVFAKRAGIDINKVQFVTTDVPGKYAALLAKRVQSAIHQVPTDALDYEAQGFPVERLLYADFGLDRLGHSLATMNKTIKEQPQVVKGFVTAVVQGWAWAKDNPEESTTLSKKFFESNLTPQTLAAQWKATFDFHHSKRTQGKPTGWMDQGDWDDTQKVLLEAAFLEKTLPLDDYYTNEFLPG